MLGLALGVFGSIIMSAIFFILSEKVYSEEDVKLIPGAKLLAVIPAKINEKHNTKFDKFLYKKIDSAYGISDDVALEKAALNMEACMGSCKKLILINAKTDQDIETLKNKLKSINQNYILNTSLNINANAIELNKLKDADGVVLLMERNMTKIEDLSSIIETVNNWQKPIVGCIVY